MDTVLGVSITSTGVGWVLADGSADGDATLDHDAFDIDGGDTSQHAVAVRGAQAIAAATGHEIRSIGVTWTHDVEPEVRQLLESLRESGYGNLVEVRLPQAAKAWVQGIGRELGYQSAAVCVVEPAAVTLLTVDAVGAVQIDVTQSRDNATADGLSHWLSEVLNGDRREPDSLLLLGSRSDRGELTGPLNEALPMPVISTAEAQLVLARGAALALATKTVATTVVGAEVEDDEISGEDEPPAGPSWISSHTRMMATIATSALPASPPIVEQVAVVNEPQAPPAPVAVAPEPVAAPAVAPGQEALPPPPPPNPVPSVLSPFFGALPGTGRYQFQTPGSFAG